MLNEVIIEVVSIPYTSKINNVAIAIINIRIILRAKLKSVVFLLSSIFIVLRPKNFFNTFTKEFELTFAKVYYIDGGYEDINSFNSTGLTLHEISFNQTLKNNTFKIYRIDV